MAVVFGLPAMADAETAIDLDAQDIAIDSYGPPDASLLAFDANDDADETLASAFAEIELPGHRATGLGQRADRLSRPRIDRAGLLRYLVSFRDHAEFHEQCVERIFVDLLARGRPRELSVDARYTRRGGLDINPWRATPGLAAPTAGRDRRQ